MTWLGVAALILAMSVITFGWVTFLRRQLRERRRRWEQRRLIVLEERERRVRRAHLGLNKERQQ